MASIVEPSENRMLDSLRFSRVSGVSREPFRELVLVNFSVNR